MTATPPPNQASVHKVTFTNVENVQRGQRVVLYGTGGIGKSTLACMMKGPVVFFDVDESLAILREQLKADGVTVPSTVTCGSWEELRNALKSDGWDKVKTIVIDTVTKIEELAVAHTLKTVKHEKGHYCQRLEDYGFGKGYQFVFDVFLPLLGDLDRHVRAGRNIVLVAHDCVTNVPNPHGEDWIRYEPRLQSPNSGKASIRLRVKEWADHVLFLGYDVNVKNGKAEGSGTRTLYCAELPHCMAKSRTTDAQITVNKGESPWSEIIK